MPVEDDLERMTEAPSRQRKKDANKKDKRRWIKYCSIPILIVWFARYYLLYVPSAQRLLAKLIFDHTLKTKKYQEKSSVVNAGKATRTHDLQEILAAKFGGDKT